MSRDGEPPLVSSRTHPLVRRMRRQAGGPTRDDATCLLDGIHLVAMAADLGLGFEAVLVDHASASEEVADLVGRLVRARAPLTFATPPVLDAASPVRSASPVVALVHHGPVALSDVLPRPGDAALIVVVDGVQDPGNVGAIVRTADAAGAAAVICLVGTADPFGWKALRGSMGSSLRVPVAVGATAHDALAALARTGVQVVALAPDARVSVADACWPARIALVVGREGAGLDPEVDAHADLRVRIPMRDGVESLNVAVAAGIALYAARHEARR